MAVTRRLILAAGALSAAGLAAPGAWATSEPGDMTIGDPTASVQVIEYASLTCPHCAAFHAEVFPEIKANYIDPGRIGFTLREFPTQPAPVSIGMFQLARCGGADAATYFERVAVLFQQQQAILATGTMGGVRDALLALGAGWGLTREQVMAALTDEAGAARVRATVEAGVAEYAISSTPTLLVNGARATHAGYADMAAALDAAGA